MWDKAKIKIELIKRGSNFTKAALDNDLYIRLRSMPT